MLTPDDIQALQKTFGDLYAKLKSAFWAASTTEEKDRIQGAVDAVNKVLDQLDTAGLEADNDAINTLTDSLQVTNKNLGDLRTQVDQIVHDVHVATEVVGAIDKAVSIAAKVMTAV